MTDPSIADSSATPDGASVPDTAIPDAETPAAQCPYCSRPFRTEQACTLHLGDAHGEAWTDDERDHATEDDHRLAGVRCLRSQEDRQAHHDPENGQPEDERLALHG